MKDTAIDRTLDLGARLRRELAGFALRPARADETPAARGLAARLIGEGIVSARDLERVHRASGGASLFLAHEEGALTGVLAFVLLGRAGLQAVRDGSFDALAPADAHLARPGQPASAFYGWGVAATTKASARRLIDGSRAIMDGVLGHLPKFARPTTEAGHRLMRERLGFVDLPASRGLVWQPPVQEAAAA